MQRLSWVDRLLAEIDDALKTFVIADRDSDSASYPARGIPCVELSDRDRRHSEGLLRVDHAGEVCAQALYRGQALGAHQDEARAFFLKAADEEMEHLRWTRYRLRDLKGRTSVFNPFWYSASFAIGWVASFWGDAFSLGFVVETEQQVLRHLDQHLISLPEADEVSRVILRQMRSDEAEHAKAAQAAGAQPLSPIVRLVMKMQSKVMTGSAYYW